MRKTLTMNILLSQKLSQKNLILYKIRLKPKSILKTEDKLLEECTFQPKINRMKTENSSNYKETNKILLDIKLMARQKELKNKEIKK